MTEDQDTPAADPYVRVRRNYLTGLFTSSLGGGMVSLTSSFLIFQQTKRASDVALIIVLSNVPSLLLPTVANKLAHRWGGPKLYLAVWGAYYSLGLVPFVLGLTGHLSAISLLAWYLLLGIVQGIGTPAAGLVRTELAPPGGSSEFNGAAVRATAVATMIGILVGGGALSIIGPSWIYLIGALSGYPLVLSVVPLLKTMVVERTGSPPKLSAARQAQRTNPEIRAAFRFGLVIFLLSGYAVTLPAIASGIGKRAIILSSLQAAAVFGGLFVVAGVRYIHRRSTWLKVQRACVIVIGVTILYLGWVALRDHQPLWYLATAVLAIIPLGFALNLDTSILNAAVQVATPQAVRTPVLTAFALIPMIALPLSEVIIGGIADLVSTSFALLLVGGGTLLLVLIPHHAAARAAFTAIDDEHVFPEADLAKVLTIEGIEAAGGVIPDQIVGPEITNPEDRDR
jgi:MFS family permease